MICPSTYCFSHVPIFQNLKPEEFEKISKMITRHVFKRGEHILLAGDIKKSLFIIRKGQVKIVKLLPNGQEQIVRISGAGDFFGDTTLFNNLPLTTNVEAIEETYICMINGDELKQLLAQNPNILFKILQEMSMRIDAIEENISEICHCDVEARVASFLVRHHDEAGTQPITMSKKDIASYLGTTRESISRKLSDFQRAGFIKIERNNIYIENIEGLNELHQSNLFKV
ncbi:Crp/Fnr family transcriptional regulator [Metasolibacillus meyeri]|uniref:Crp/Fnr family transcriptional regulator n=1 Tax=Metasolibacillus meyeri TaxID=1071052 RepID=UPI000D317177|nr:Crp/Fnr family transcriptional regulator [Metasolibacillus meyeri]